MTFESSAYNKTARWTCYTAGCIFILLGVFSVLHPFWAVASTAVFMGVGFLLSGINSLVPYLSMKNVPERPKWLLPMAVIDIAFGLFFISHIGLAIFTLSTLVGVWVLLGGFTRCYMAFHLRSSGVEKWWAPLISAPLMIAVGALLLSNPFVAVIWISVMVGLTLTGAGMLSIVEGKILYPPEKK
jgi:uncharacterized membrane protein HdeD (DUF308 family)